MTQRVKLKNFKEFIYLFNRPRWFSPGMIFLGFLAKSPHLQLLNEDEYKKVTSYKDSNNENLK